jgi:two-component system heavy metal sensor histidine kinase CusS
MLEHLRVVLLAAVVLGTLGAGLIAQLTVRRGLRPLLELANQTQRMAPHRLDGRLFLEAHARELQPFIEQFNALIERCERAYRQLESFNADVAHELRTPLSALIGQTELALSRERSGEEMRETLLSNLEELQRLTTMTNDMLFLSRADHGAAARRDAPRSLAELVNQVAEFQEGIMQERGLKVQIVGDAAWQVEPGLFKQAVSNLLDNASRHASTGSIIKIYIAPSARDAVRIVVENTGAELPPEHVPRLFDRFFRGDSSRSDGESHHGLGLAIVAAVARMHRGTAWAESLPGTTRVGFTVA